MPDGFVGSSHARYRVLSSEEIQLLHESSLTIMAELGVRVLHDGGLDLLADAGANVDRASGMAKLPFKMVEDCIKSTPSEFTMAARDPVKDVHLAPGGKLYARNGGGPGHIVDDVTHTVRDATLADVKAYARLVDAMEYVDIVAPVYGQDLPPKTRDLRVLAAMFASTTKHINMRVLNPDSLPYVLQMAEVVAGGRNELRMRPLITMLESPIAPLKLPEVLVETLLASGEYGIPVEICSMPITGATGPITLAGSLLMSNVEMLAAVVISQLAHPGAPLVFTPRIMVMDMASGHALTGSMENALLATAGVQLALEAYQIPVNMHGPYTDAMLGDFQAGFENTYFSILPALAGANILTGAGHLQGGLTISLSQLVLDNEIMGTVQRAMHGFQVNTETLGVEAIKRSIAQSSMLTDEHTMVHLRRVERYRSKLLTREPRETWVASGSKEMRDKATEQVRHLLDSHQPEPLHPDKERALGEIIQAAATQLESL